MPSTWTINGSSPESLGLRLVGGEFRSGAASTVRLEVAAACDAAAAFAHEAAVTIHRDGAVMFSGTVRALNRTGSAASEGQVFLVEDAWAQLERTTYQEPWGTGADPVLLPQVVLGMKSDGSYIDLGEQIAEVIAFAADAGIDIQCGTMPTGLDLWPSQQCGMSCAEVIRHCLRYHPDWMPWIDHSTTPPTFQVTPRASASVATLPLAACEAIHIQKMEDRIPDAVRIVYTSSTEIDGTVFRDVAVDKWPSTGPDSGPGVLTTVVELAGGQASIAKQQIEVVPVPALLDPEDDEEAAGEKQDAIKAWLAQIYPWLREVPAAGGEPSQGVAADHFVVTEFSLAPVVDIDDHEKPVPVNPRALALGLRTMADAPNMLIAGSIQEWMRVRSGTVVAQFECSPAPAATDDECAVLRTLNDAHTLRFIGTNATSKIYKGRPQWASLTEGVPAGIAHAYYDSIAAGCMFEGSASLIDSPDETSPLAAMSWAGRVLNVSGGASEWAAMKAPIHGITWAAQTEAVSISFGPNADYSPQDFLEYLRLLRARPVTWYSPAERISGELGGGGGNVGSEQAPSAAGDAVGPNILPKEISNSIPRPEFPPFTLEIVKEMSGGTPTPKVIVHPGRVIDHIVPMCEEAMTFHEVPVLDESDYPIRLDCTEDGWIYVKVEASTAGGDIMSTAIEYAEEELSWMVTDVSITTFHYPLGQTYFSAGRWRIRPFLAGSHIYHRSTVIGFL